MKIKKELLDKILDCVLCVQDYKDELSIPHVHKGGTYTRLEKAGIEIEEPDYLAEARNTVNAFLSDFCEERFLIKDSIALVKEKYEKAIKQLQEKNK